MGAARPRPGRRELAAVGVLFGLVLLTTSVTYARVPPEDLYNVSEDGLAGGLGRALVELNFPVAVMAVPVVLVATDALGGRVAAAVGAVALLASLVVVVPGVVEPSDLDPKAVNAVPAAGVGIAVALTAAAWPRLCWTTPRLPGDPARVALAAAIVVAAIPWIFAELGLYAPDPILADEPTPGEDIAAVHLGSHEGMDGALLALGALALSRLTPWLAARRLAAVASTLLALLLAYGVANIVQDDWLEQVVKRGWSGWEIPSFVQPQISVGWAIVFVGGIAVELLWFKPERRAVLRGLPHRVHDVEQ